MSNLIPTARTDKNGVTRIRHMKPDAASSSSRKPIPRVAAVPPAVTEKHRQLAAKLIDMGLGVYREGLREKTAAAIPDDRVGQWIEFLSRKHGNLTPNELSRRVMVAVENPKHGKPLLDRIYNYLDELLEDDPEMYPFSLFVGLDDYKKQKYSREQELALVKATHAVSYIPGGTVDSKVPFPFEGYSISDPKLRDLVSSRPEQVDEIIEIIRKQKTPDGGRIEAILDSGVHSELQEGVL